MQIRRAVKTDIPELIRLLQQVGQVHHRIRPDIFRSGAQKYDAAALEALLADPGRPVLAGFEGDRMLGYCFGILTETVGDPVLLDEKSLYIDDLCVDEACRGKHVGSRLYEAMLSWAREAGCRNVTLNVWSGNDSAMAFYHAKGMKPRKVYMEVSLEDKEC